MKQKKNNLVEWAMQYRSIVLLVTSCLMAFGVYSLKEMNKNEFPDFTIRQGIVVAVCPGVSSEDVEQQVTKPLEDYIFSYKEVKKEKTKSYSRNGMCIVQVELNDDFNDKDAFWSKFKLGVEQFRQTSLPKGVLAVVVNDDFGDASALLITMESNDKTYRELNDYMRQLKDELRTIESVGRMTVVGLQKEQISITLSAEKLSHYGLSEQTIALTLFSKGFQTTAGTLKTGDYDSPVYVSRSMNAVADVEQQVVYASPTGQVLRLKDVATVRREYAAPSSYVTNNGRKCLVLSVEMKKGRNITAMGSDIDRALQRFSQTLPADVTTFKITDQAQVVGDSVWNFLKELLIAILAVVLVVMLLMPMRVALVASSTIPITIFIALGLFHAFNIELNTVTLAALIVTLGMIVDNSIVIIDSYVEMLAEGQDRWHATVSSATHFFRSILSATLAISITFFPFLLMMKGTMHDFVEMFPWAVSIVLLVSLAVAELLVPFLQYWFIRGEKKEGRGESIDLLRGEKKEARGERIDLQNEELSSHPSPLTPHPSPLTSHPSPLTSHPSLLSTIQRGYDWLIDACFRHPKTTIAVGIGSVVAGAVLFTLLPQKLMPAADRNQFAVEIYLPTGTALTQTAALADSLERVLQQDERVVSIASFKGMASPRFQAGYAPQFGGPNYAQFIVNTTSNKATVEVLHQYRPLYENAFPGAYVKFKQIEYSDIANPVEVRLTGDDWALLKQTADSVTAMLRQRADLRLVRTDLNEPLFTTQVQLLPDQSARFGLSALAIESTLAMRYNSDGLTLATLWDGDYGTNICLKSSHANRATMDDVANELVPVYGGVANVPLRQVASITPTWQDGQIAHRNGLRTITVMAEVAQGLNVTAVNQQLQAVLDTVALPAGVTLSYGGEVENSAENMPRLISSLLVAVAIIFFILLAHFRRIGTALLLLASLTLCFFGTTVGVLVTGVDFSLTCFLGIVSLMGILVRNAIIMYDYADELRSGGQMSAHEAIHQSAKRRMRPIFLTSAAASMGVIPMILGRSSLWMPMGAVICFGTLITMVLILTVLPIAYSLTHK